MYHHLAVSPLSSFSLGAPCVSMLIISVLGDKDTPCASDEQHLSATSVHLITFRNRLHTVLTGHVDGIGSPAWPGCADGMLQNNRLNY